MFNEIQSAKVTKATIHRLLRTHIDEDGEGTRRSLSGLFKAVRRDSRVDLLGDYVLMAYILEEVQHIFPSHKWTKVQMYHALNFCKFWHEEGRTKKYIPKEWLGYIHHE